MRAPVLALLLLATPLLLAAPADATVQCSFNTHAHVIPPGTNFYVAADRSFCTDGVKSQHKEVVLVTEGEPYQPGTVVLARIEYVSTETLYVTGAKETRNVVSAEHDGTTVAATHKTTRSPAGLTTCSVSADVQSPGTRFGQTVADLPVCLTPEQAHK